MSRTIRTAPDAAAAALARYDRAAVDAASVVIRRYSTSFGMATRLLDPSVRADVRVVYALVRISDEIVDGAADGAGEQTDPEALLDELECETLRAIETGYSTNLIVHAFARTARSAGIGADLISPFFRSMRADLTVGSHDPASFDDYVYGSAEVVGLMCLRVFLREEPRDAVAEAALVDGAKRLGAAFQKVNFLRDLAADTDGLGRRYFPNVDVADLDETTKLRLVADIDADLAAAAAVIPTLPRCGRRAVTAAHDLFADLNDRIRRTPAADLAHRRIRVPDAVKLARWLRAAAGARPLPR